MCRSKTVVLVHLVKYLIQIRCYSIIHDLHQHLFETAAKYIRSPLFWIGVKNLQMYPVPSCNAISMRAWERILLQIFNPYPERCKAYLLRCGLKKMLMCFMNNGIASYLDETFSEGFRMTHLLWDPMIKNNTWADTSAKQCITSGCQESLCLMPNQHLNGLFRGCHE